MASANLNRWSITLRILLMLVFVAAGGMKLAGVSKSVALFDQIGLGQGFRLLTGVVEVTGGLALLFRPSALLAALALAVTMAVAVGVHLLRVGGSPLPALWLLMLCGGVAWLARSREPAAPSA